MAYTETPIVGGRRSRRRGDRPDVRTGRGRVAPAGADHVPAGGTGRMLIITKRNATEEALDAIKEYLTDHGFDIHQSTGANRTILGVIGDTDSLDEREIGALQGVSQVIRIKQDDCTGPRRAVRSIPPSTLRTAP